VKLRGRGGVSKKCPIGGQRTFVLSWGHAQKGENKDQVGQDMQGDTKMLAERKEKKARVSNVTGVCKGGEKECG